MPQNGPASNGLGCDCSSNHYALYSAVVTASPNVEALLWYDQFALNSSTFDDDKLTKSTFFAPLFLGSSNVPLAGAIAKALGQQLGELSLGTFPDGETKVEIIDPIRGHDVFVIQVRPFASLPQAFNWLSVPSYLLHYLLKANVNLILLQ